MIKWECSEIKDWNLESTLTKDTQFTSQFQCILYDAYSGSTSPELWEDDFLESFLSKAAAPNCLLSTYAAKGSLTRALQKQQFEVQLRTGFGGKRQSTWATRHH